jgi:hypothetical protein
MHKRSREIQENLDDEDEKQPKSLKKATAKKRSSDDGEIQPMSRKKIKLSRSKRNFDRVDESQRIESKKKFKKSTRKRRVESHEERQVKRVKRAKQAVRETCIDSASHNSPGPSSGPSKDIMTTNVEDWNTPYDQRSQDAFKYKMTQLAFKDQVTQDDQVTRDDLKVEVQDCAAIKGFDENKLWTKRVWSMIHIMISLEFITQTWFAAASWALH